MIVNDADAHYKTEIENDAEIVLDVKNAGYGVRGYTFKDVAGNLWNFGTLNPWK